MHGRIICIMLKPYLSLWKNSWPIQMSKYMVDENLPKLWVVIWQISVASSRNFVKWWKAVQKSKNVLEGFPEYSKASKKLFWKSGRTSKISKTGKNLSALQGWLEILQCSERFTRILNMHKVHKVVCKALQKLFKVLEGLPENIKNK